MKKSFLTSAFILSMLCIGFVSAQSVQFYKFKAEQGNTYTQLGEDAVSLARTMETAAADIPLTVFNATESLLLQESTASMAGIPIGFDFTFEGKVYDKFLASGIGYIWLGLKSDAEVEVNLQGTPTINNIYRMVSPTIGLGANTGLAFVSPVKYLLSGDEGNRVLAVEYSIQYNDQDVWRYQIRLYEEDNRIELLFDEITIKSGWYQFLCIGISGEDGAHYRTATSTNFLETEQSANGGGMITAERKFDRGLLYTFSLPDPCQKPSLTAVLNLEKATSTALTVIATMENADADAYLLLVSPTPVTGKPVDGTFYKEGDELLGGKVISLGDLPGTVIKSTYGSEFGSDMDASYDYHRDTVEPNTVYHYSLWFYNYKCTGDVRYGDVSAFQATTLTGAPAELNMVSVSDAEIRLNTVANASNEEVLVAVTDRHGKDDNSNVLNKGDFGIPGAQAKAGDTLYKADGSFGGVVLYMGKAGTEVSFTQVEDNKVYHFGAFSRRSDGVYSTTFAQADLLSPARIPFTEDFEQMISFYVPIGWDGTSSAFTKQRNGGLQYSFAAVTTENDTVREACLAFPPMDFPAKSVRLIMEYLMTGYEGYVNSAYNPARWSETDSIVFEVSTDNGLTYTPAYAITKSNADRFASTSDRVTRMLTIKGYGNVKAAKLRLRWATSQKNTHALNIYSFRLLEVPECDYPTRLEVVENSLESNQVQLTWTIGENEERVWNLAYSVATGDETEWMQVDNVAQRPYTISGLQSSTTYRARVQAVCGVGSVSEWTESETFTTGLGVPFLEDFNNLPIVMNPRATITLPVGWDMKSQTGTLPEILDMDQTGTAMSYFYKWKQTSQAVPGKDNGTVTFPVGLMASATAIMRLPAIRLDAEASARFVFDAAYGSVAGSFTTVEKAANENYRMYLWVSTDGGKTFVTDNTLGLWSADEMAAFGDSTRIEKDLSEWAGQEIVLAVGVTGVLRSSAEMLWLDNMGVVYECPTARNLRLKQLGINTATLVWDEDFTVSQWLVKYRKDENQIIETAESSRIELSDLSPRTPYTVYVGHLCEEDTSAWSQYSFVTGGEDCAAVKSVEVSDITRNGARLAWEGEAMGYRIRIRVVGQENYTFYTTDATGFEFDNLLPERNYEGGVQALCSMADGDMSEYTDFESFITVGITCFAPTQIKVEPSYASAVVGWEGEAEEYQLAYRQEGAAEISGMVNVAENNYTLTGLNEKTPYQVRLRSICTAGDMSAWSEWETFTTTETPVCPQPTDLKAESIEQTSALLTWNCTEENAGFILRFRESAVTVWDSVKNLEETGYLLAGLKPNTAYSWAVLTACSGNRYSGWASSTFTTEGAANENVLAAAFKVYATKGQIHVLNPGALQIDGVRVIGTDGLLLGRYQVKSDENLLLTISQSAKVAVVLIEHNGKTAQYKVYLP